MKIFAKEYIVDFNGSAAAVRAGYSKPRARITASELLNKPDIINEINRLISLRNVKTEDAAQRVIRELETIAYARTTDFIKVKDVVVKEGRTRRKMRVAIIELTDDIEKDKHAAIAEIKQTKDGVSFKAHDKTKALELLGRHHGIFEKDNTQSKPVVFSKKITFK